MYRPFCIPAGLLVLLLNFWFSLPLQAADGPPAIPFTGQLPESMPPALGPPQPVGDKPLLGSAPELLAPGVYRIGLVQLDKAERSLTFPARINQDKGLLEYLLVRTGGKTHESLLRTEAEPFDIQLACLLLNLEGTLEPLAYQGAPEQPRGEPVRLTVAVPDEKGRIHEFPPELWLSKVIAGTAQDIDRLNWVFTGSRVSDGRFMAQMDGSVIALYHDPAAIIDNASPGGESDEVWFVNEKTVPRVGTQVTVTVKPAK